MNRSTLKTAGLPIGNPNTDVHYDPITALVVASVAGTGASIYQASEAKSDAKKEAAKQAGLIKEQEAKIEAEKLKQTKEAQARRERATKKELLTGTEQGLTGEPTGTLLAGGE